jgi:hypothetical protein
MTTTSSILLIRCIPFLNHCCVSGLLR